MSGYKHTTADDAEKMMKLHHVFYKVDKEFKDKIENHERTMWLFSNNYDVRKKNVDKLVEILKANKLPVVRLNCWYNTSKKQSGKERCAYMSYFEEIFSTAACHHHHGNLPSSSNHSFLNLILLLPYCICLWRICIVHFVSRVGL